MECIKYIAWLLFFFTLYQQQTVVFGNRSFVIDYDNNQFLKDGEPFRYISGSIHYFRVPRVYWEDRFDKMKAGGLNTIQTYVDWSQHEPEPGRYDFSDNLDIVTFITLAGQKGLNVVLRPGPYICAERDFGGLPYWLLRENPSMVIRSSDPSYLNFVDKWFNIFFPMISSLLYVNGGPIITVQVENEYGSYYTCDLNYTTHLRDLFRSILGNDIVLFTTDGAADYLLECGKIQDVYATVDFGPGSDVKGSFQVQREFEPRGPLVNSEFYTGWLDHWGEPHNTISPLTPFTLNQILALNASVNMYMYHGGTNFKFTNGANMGSTYEPDPTSYDYDAPISEAGDTTNSFYKIREVIAQYVQINDPVPSNTTKTSFGPIPLNSVGTIFELLPLIIQTPSISVNVPITAAAYGQAYGFILYEKLMESNSVNETLTVLGIEDRGYVFVNQMPVGLLDRATNVTSIIISIEIGSTLSILVENQGRIGFSVAMATEVKGIVGDVTLGSVVLTSWRMSSVPLNNTDLFRAVTPPQPNSISAPQQKTATYPVNLPVFYSGQFIFAQEPDGPYDTFLDPTGWTKGVVFINGYNIGRYWPVRGPQVTLFVPKSVLLPYPDDNSIVLFEQEQAHPNQTINFVTQPILNSPVNRLGLTNSV